MSDFGLQGRRALVTGATGGIGSAVAEAFAQEGMDVAIHYHTQAEKAQQMAEELGRAHLGQRFVAVGADLKTAGGARELVTLAAEGLGGLDVLVNNAGINRDKTLKKADVQEWLSVLDLNLLGAAHCAREALAYLGEGGRIISISSIVGFTGNFGQTNYGAAKAGLVGLTKSLALEVGAKGITANAIAPGFIDTPMTADMPEPARRLWEERTPLGRFGRPEEIAYCVLFLASPRASYINGAVLHANGGSY